MIEKNEYLDLPELMLQMNKRNRIFCWDVRALVSLGLVMLFGCASARTVANPTDPELRHPAYVENYETVVAAIRAAVEGSANWQFVSEDKQDATVDLTSEGERTGTLDQVRIRIVALEAGGVSLMLSSQTSTRVPVFGGQRKNLIWLVDQLDQRLTRRAR